MKILVTGGTGYIGSHTVVELLNSGYDVVVADNLSNSSVTVIDAIGKICGRHPAFFQTELCNPDDVQELFARNPGIDGVIHFAAFKAVGESTLQPLKYYHNNLFSLINLLQAMQTAGVNNLVFSSSCTVYGQPDSLPVDENAPVKPALSPYGNTKQISEDIIRHTVAGSRLECISLRYFNPIGAHESALIGELPLGIPNNLVPFITQTAIGIRETLNVFGNDYNTPDGTCIRDYIHVADIAAAHVIALNRMREEKAGRQFEVFNLGTGRGTSVIEAIHSFEKVSGTRLNYRFAPRRPGDVEQVWADTSLANKILGWKAQRDLDQMMLTAWNWEKHLAESNN